MHYNREMTPTFSPSPEALPPQKPTPEALVAAILQEYKLTLKVDPARSPAATLRQLQLLQGVLDSLSQTGLIDKAEGLTLRLADLDTTNADEPEGFEHKQDRVLGENLVAVLMRQSEFMAKGGAWDKYETAYENHVTASQARPDGDHAPEELKSPPSPLTEAEKEEKKYTEAAALFLSVLTKQDPDNVSEQDQRDVLETIVAELRAGEGQSHTKDQFELFTQCELRIDLDQCTDGHIALKINQLTDAQAAAYFQAKLEEYGEMEVKIDESDFAGEALLASADESQTTAEMWTETYAEAQTEFDLAQNELRAAARRRQYNAQVKALREQWQALPRSAAVDPPLFDESEALFRPTPQKIDPTAPDAPLRLVLASMSVYAQPIAPECVVPALVRVAETSPEAFWAHIKPLRAATTATLTQAQWAHVLTHAFQYSTAEIAEAHTLADAPGHAAAMQHIGEIVAHSTENGRAPATVRGAFRGFLAEYEALQNADTLTHFDPLAERKTHLDHIKETEQMLPHAELLALLKDGTDVIALTQNDGQRLRDLVDGNVINNDEAQALLAHFISESGGLVLLTSADETEDEKLLSRFFSDGSKTKTELLYALACAREGHQAVCAARAEVEAIYATLPPDVT